MAKIEVKNLSKVFGPRPKETLENLPEAYVKNEVFAETGNNVAVYDANFEVNEGELFVIIGLSGSGKSTLIRMLNLLNRPTSGEIIVDGENIITYDSDQITQFRRKKVSMVFQNFGLLTHKNVLDNVAFGLEINGMSKEERTRKAEEAVKLVGLSGYEYCQTSELSGGMKQRVGLARALACDSEIILMDEPFSALDPIVRREMQFELLKIQKSLKKTIIFITHDINEAFKLGDRIVIMLDGKIVQQGIPEQILHEPANDFVSNFIMDIDRTKVIQAKQIMTFPSTIVFENIGPHLALKEMKQNGLSSVFVVGNDMKLIGLLPLDGVLKAIEKKLPVSEVIVRDIPKTCCETKANDLLALAANAPYPISVTDKAGKLLGIVTKAAVMSSVVS